LTLRPCSLFSTGESVVDSDEGRDDQHDGQHDVVRHPQDFLFDLK
jgi:hypothetical protein